MDKAKDVPEIEDDVPELISDESSDDDDMQSNVHTAIQQTTTRNTTPAVPAPPKAAPVKKPPAKKVAEPTPPPPPPAGSDDDIPDLVSDSPDDSSVESKSKPKSGKSTTTPAKAKTTAKPAAKAASSAVDSSDEESGSEGEEGGAAGAKRKKRKNKKKKKPKKKSDDAEDATAAGEKVANPPRVGAEGGSKPISLPANPAGSAQPAPKPAPKPAPIDPQVLLEQTTKTAFINRWQKVIDTLTEVSRKAALKTANSNNSTGKASANSALNDLRFSWAAKKFEYDVIVENTEEERRMQELTTKVLALEDTFDDSDLYEDEDSEPAETPIAENASTTLTGARDSSSRDMDANAETSPIDLSIAVKKWLERADERYRRMFQERINQLASGQRSYALSKRLKHCSFPIYETKLDAGQRILWTKLLREDTVETTKTETLIVWFAAKHDQVPHLLRLIERSCVRTIRQVESRTGQQQVTDSSTLMSQVAPKYVMLAEGARALQMLHLPEEAVLLDPQGNIPLKIYPVPDISQLAVPNWRAPLRLNKLEQSVRKQSGTVLLLGRSGTGKTLCLMDRMHHDRIQLQLRHFNSLSLAASVDTSAGADDSAVADASTGVANCSTNSNSSSTGSCSESRPPSQLFVARSLQLCELVKRYQQHNAMDSSNMDIANYYMRMRQFLADMERKLMCTQRASSATSDDGATSPDSTSAAPVDKLFHQTHREIDCVDYLRFSREIYPVITQTIANKTSSGGGGKTSNGVLDALIVWTQIRSFMKGSIDAILQGGMLSLNSYLDMAVFSKDRCRLQVEQRRQAYELFQRYERYLQEKRLWDDMDKIRSILLRALPVYGKSEVDATKLLRDTPWVPYFNKIYVDEVQDYTQAEIAVFLLAVGFKTDALFLAGDPAQSVVEGVDFRFEEVRTLVYKLTAGRESVQRPIKLITNYRSHNGVLACAAAIIEKLLLMFPGSANVLSKDEGLFTGPRPNYCVARDPVEMLRVIGKDVAVLAPDSSPWLKRAAAGTDSDPTPSAAPSNEMEGGGVIGGAVDGEEDTEEVEEGAGTTFSPAPHKGTTSTTTVSTTGGGNSSSGGDGGGILHLGNTVMGIRAAKGLEFSDVMILDFFRHIPEHDHRAWKVLFSDSTQTADVAVRDKQFEYPQLEPQLKMLYTAITRSMNRLVFVESDVTPAGDAFFRWLERHQLAEKYDLATARKRGEERFITADEWKVRGIQFAGQVDSATTGGAEAAEGLLDNAIQCFTNAGDTVLKNAAALQKRLVLCKLKVLNMGTSAAGADRIGGAKDSAEALETEVHKAIVAGVEGGLFEDTRDLCELWAEQLQPEYLKPVFRAQVYDLLGKLCDF